MMIGAVVLVIAGSGLMPTPSPEMATLAGTYSLLLSRPTGDERLTLVLDKDGMARLITEDLGEMTASTTQSGVWTVENGAVKLALNASGGQAQRQMTLGIREDSLVANENDSNPEDGQSWTFRRR
jgi:hypothetical protein